LYHTQIILTSFFTSPSAHPPLHSFPTRRSSDLISLFPQSAEVAPFAGAKRNLCDRKLVQLDDQTSALAKFWSSSCTSLRSHRLRSEEHTSELQSRGHLVCRLLLEKKKKKR